MRTIVAVVFLFLAFEGVLASPQPPQLAKHACSMRKAGLLVSAINRMTSGQQQQQQQPVATVQLNSSQVLNNRFGRILAGNISTANMSNAELVSHATAPLPKSFLVALSQAIEDTFHCSLHDFVNENINLLQKHRSSEEIEEMKQALFVVSSEHHIAKDLDGNFIRHRYYAGPQGMGTPETAKAWLSFYRTVFSLACMMTLFLMTAFQYSIRAVWPSYKILQVHMRNGMLVLMLGAGALISIAITILGLTNAPSKKKWAAANGLMDFMPFLLGLFFTATMANSFSSLRELGGIFTRRDENLANMNHDFSRNFFLSRVNGALKDFEKVVTVCCPGKGTATVFKQPGDKIQKGEIIARLDVDKKMAQLRSGMYKFYQKVRHTLPSTFSPSEASSMCGTNDKYTFESGGENVILVKWINEKPGFVGWAEDQQQDMKLANVLFLVSFDEPQAQKMKTWNEVEISLLKLELASADRNRVLENDGEYTKVLASEYVLFGVIAPAIVLVLIVSVIVTALVKVMNIQHCTWDDTLPECANYTPPHVQHVHKHVHRLIAAQADGVTNEETDTETDTEVTFGKMGANNDDGTGQPDGVLTDDTNTVDM